jgi:hypothetical protein
MTKRLIVFLLFLAALAGICLWNRSMLGFGSIFEMWLVYVPIIVIIGPAILFPRNWAIGWCMTCGLLAIGLLIASALELQSCNGEACIGLIAANIFVLAPIVVGLAVIAAVRFFAKGTQRQVEQA